MLNEQYSYFDNTNNKYYKIYDKGTNLKLSWNNISVWLKERVQQSFCNFETDKYNKIINNVSGVIYSRNLMAIMGGSGSGKTTLLTALSQRTGGVTIGEILLNGNHISRDQMKAVSSFIPQQEILANNLTVTEHLQFMARVKMDKCTKSQERNQRIYIILRRIGLTQCTDRKISVLSGGELKRLSLAVNLLTDPPLLFCDEPTTGLDSYNAETIIKILQNICKLGKAIICTIHQPTSGIFEMFEQVTFLANGSLIYHGPVDKVSLYFNSLSMHCPFEGYNPVEFYITQLVTLEKDSVAVQKMYNNFYNSTFFKKLKKELNSKDVWIRNGNKYNCDKIIKYYENVYGSNKINRWTQFNWLLWRCFVNLKRNWKNIMIRFLLYMFIAIILSTMYWDIASTVEQKDIQNLEGLMFLIITETIFTFAYSVFHTFPAELPNLLRELSNGLYKPLPYYLSKVLSLIPIVILETFCYSGIIFWSVGLKGGFYGYFLFYLPILLSALSSTAYGFFLSTTFQSVGTASLVSVPLDFIAMTYSGIYINISHLPWITSWLPYVSQFYFGTKAISTVQWNNISNITCENPDLSCLSTGLEILEKYGYENGNYCTDLLGLVFYFVCYHVFAFLSLCCNTSKQPVY